MSVNYFWRQSALVCATLLLSIVSDPSAHAYYPSEQNWSNYLRDSDVTKASPRPPSLNTSGYFTYSPLQAQGTRTSLLGAGGDRLVNVVSTSTLSFFPRNIALSEKMLAHVNKFLPVCAAEAARTAGYQGSISKINISHFQGYINRRINTNQRGPRVVSLHAAGRALDLARLDLTIGGRTVRIPMTKQSNDGRYGRDEKVFYQTFNNCWKRNTQTRCGQKGILDCHYNSLHHNHVHLSLPFCPRKRGIAGT